MSEFKGRRKNARLFFCKLGIALPRNADTKYEIWCGKISRNENNSSRGLNSVGAARCRCINVVNHKREKGGEERESEREQQG